MDLEPPLLDNSVGPELVTNGAFGSTGGWSVATGGSLTLSGGRGRVTRNPGPGTASALQIVSGLTIGRLYLVSAESFAGTAVSREIRVKSGAATLAVAVDANLDATFAAASTSPSVRLNVSANAPGQYAEFDNVSLKATPFFSVTVQTTVSPSLFTNTQTFYGPSLGTNLVPSLLTNAQSFYAPTLSFSGLSPSLFTNTITFYPATVGSGSQIFPELFDNSASGLFDDGIFDPDLFDTGPVIFAATVTADPVTLLPALFTNEQTFFETTIPPPLELIPSLYTNNPLIYLPGVWGRPETSEPSWAGADASDADWAAVAPSAASWGDSSVEESIWTPVIPTDGSWA